MIKFNKLRSGFGIIITLNLMNTGGITEEFKIDHSLIWSNPMLNNNDRFRLTKKLSVTHQDFLMQWNQKSPGEPGNEPVNSSRGGEPCAIAPLGTIWHQQPRFVWQGEVRQIKLSRSPSGASQFDLAVTSKGEKLTSSAVSPQSLAAGKEYEYKFEYKGKDGRYIRTQSSTIVEIMENGQRRTEIAKALAAIEQQVPRNTKNRQEQVALQKADYFVKQNSRSDALQEIFSVSSPSSQLQVVQAEIVKSRCSSN